MYCHIAYTHIHSHHRNVGNDVLWEQGASAKSWRSLDLEASGRPPLKTQRSSSMPTPKSPKEPPEDGNKVRVRLGAISSDSLNTIHSGIERISAYSLHMHVNTGYIHTRTKEKSNMVPVCSETVVESSSRRH